MQRGNTSSLLASGFALGLGLSLICNLSCTRTVEPPRNVTIEDIKENPSAYVNQTVTVSGEIEKIYGPRAFRMGGPDFFGNEVRVLTLKPLKPGIRRRADEPMIVRDLVLVTGVIRTISIAEIERELKLDLAPDVEIEYANRPILIAASVLVTARSGEPMSATTPSSGSTQKSR